MRFWVWSVAMSTACSFPTTPWRDLGSGEFVGGYAQFGADDCVAFVPVVLTDQAAFDAWSATLLGIPSAAGVDWATEVVVGVSANCRNLGRTIAITDAAPLDVDTLSVEYLVVANYESLDALSVLWHAAAFEVDTWNTVSATVTFQ